MNAGISQPPPVGPDQISDAIKWCDAKILDHRTRAVRSAVFVIALFAIFASVLAYFTPPLAGPSLLQAGIVAYSGAGVLFSVFCVLGVSLYKLHAQEIIAKENYILDLYRIAIATSGEDKQSFKTEVRIALTRGAFETRSDKALKTRSAKIEP